MVASASICRRSERANKYLDFFLFHSFVSFFFFFAFSHLSAFGLRFHDLKAVSDLIKVFVFGCRRSSKANRDEERFRQIKNRMEHNETGFQAPERPILCINNCGFFGSSATMNMCSKCHKDMILKREQEQEQAKLALPTIDNLANVSSSSSHKDHIVSANVDVDAGSVEPKLCLGQSSNDSGAAGIVAMAKAGGPNRCNACGKRVGLAGFSCRCGNVFCATHRYSDKHDCQFDYRRAAQNAIAKANPVVKGEKLEKI